VSEKIIIKETQSGPARHTTYSDGSTKTSYGNGITHFKAADGSEKVVLRCWLGGRGSKAFHRTYIGPSALYDAQQKKADIDRMKRVGVEVVLAEEVGRVALATFCSEHFWPNHVVSELEYRTQVLYASTLDKYVIPKWGSWPMRTIRRADIKEWRRELQREGHSAHVINRAVGLLKSIFTYAIDELDWPLPHPGTRLPSLPTMTTHNRDARDPITVERIRACVADEPGIGHLEAMERQAYVSVQEHGLRPSEGAALLFSDVITPGGHPRGTILIERALSGDPSNPTKLTKTNQHREVTFFDFVQKEILELWMARGQPRRDEAIFRQPDGSLWREPGLYYKDWWPAAVARAGSEPFDIYCLRHTAASYQLLTKKPVEVAPQLGHSESTCRRTYDHPLGPEADRWRGMDYDAIIKTARAEVAAERERDALGDVASA